MLRVCIKRLFKVGHPHIAHRLVNDLKQRVMSLRNRPIKATSPELLEAFALLNKIALDSPNLIPSSIHLLSLLSASKDILASYEEKILQGIKYYDSYSLIYIARAYSRIDIGSKLIFQKISKRARQIIKDFNVEAIYALISAFVRVEHTDEELILMLSAQAFKSAEKLSPSEISNIIHIFSIVKCKEFLIKMRPIIEKQLINFNYQSKLQVLKSYHDIGIPIPILEQNILENVNVLSLEDFTSLCSYISTHESIREIYEKSLLIYLNNHDPCDFSPQSTVYIINSFHELGHGEELCYFFLNQIHSIFRDLKSHEYPLLMYIYGIHQISDEVLWSRFYERFKEDIYSVNITDLCRGGYGLFKSAHLDAGMYKVITKRATKELLYPKSIIKFIEIGGFFHDPEFLKVLKKKFIGTWQHMPVNKAIICIDEFRKVHQMDTELIEIADQLKLQFNK